MLITLVTVIPLSQSEIKKKYMRKINNLSYQMQSQAKLGQFVVGCTLHRIRHKTDSPQVVVCTVSGDSHTRIVLVQMVDFCCSMIGQSLRALQTI